MPNRVRVALCLAAAVAMAAVWPSSRTTALSAADHTVLAVSGRTNSTPWIAADGAFVAVVWGASAAGKADVYLAISRDSGRTFGAPVRVNRDAGDARLGGELPPRVALHRAGGAVDPEVAVLWNARSSSVAIKLARSRDGGKSFSVPETLQAPGAAGDRGWPALALDARGGAHAIWLDHRGLVAGKEGSSSSGHKPGEKHDGYAMALKSGLYYSSGPSTERELTKGVCYCCKTALVSDADGRLFAAWRQVYPGGFRDMAFTTSSDGGRTFAAPSRINEDGWAIDACPDDGPAMAVGGDGRVHVIWPTVTGGENNPQGVLRYASSTDGRTFGAPFRISTMSQKPEHPQIVLDKSGRIVVAWDETPPGQRGQRVAMMRPLTVGADRKVTEGAIVKLEDGPSEYPVMAPASGGLVAAWTSGTREKSVIAVRVLN